MTEARKRANEKWNKENYATVSARVPKTTAAQLKDKLGSYDLSVHAFIKAVCVEVINGNTDILNAVLTMNEK